MKLVVPCLSEYDFRAESHTTIITDSSQVVCLKKTEDGTWLNGKWNGRGVYRYTIVLNGGKYEYISEETFNSLQALMYENNNITD